LERELYLFKHFVRERGCCLFFSAFIPITREIYTFGSYNSSLRT